MKLSLRFVVLVVALVAAVAASATAGLSALSRLNAALHSVVDTDVTRLLAITHSRRLFRSMVVHERDYILAKVESERSTIARKIATLSSELTVQLDKYVQLMPAQDARTIADIRGAQARWIERDFAVRAAAARGQDEALALARGHAADPVSWEREIGGLVKLSETRLDTQIEDTDKIYAAARSQMLWVSVIAALTAAVFGFVIFLGIGRALREVVRLNEDLEGQVKARTESLVQREHALRLILDSTGEGLFEVDRAGRLTNVPSVAAIRWFGAPRPDEALAGFLCREQPAQAEQLEVAFAQLAEDVLPWELCLDQMPRQIRRGDLILELDWKQVMKDGKFTNILVVVRDVTEAVQSSLAEKSAREQQSLITKLLQDKTGFSQFVKDCERLLSSLASGDGDILAAQRDLHTLKGNVAIFGLTSVAELCHSLEDRIAATNAPPSSYDLADLAGLWRTRMQSIEAFLIGLDTKRLDVEPLDHAQLVDSLVRRQDYDEILRMVTLWSWPRMAERLARHRAHAEHLAQRLGRAVRVHLEHNEVRVPPSYLEKFWPTLIHVVRNAVDHGAEPPEVRAAAGKPTEMQLVFATEQREDAIIIEVRDDGPGIDHSTLLRRAYARHPELAQQAEPSMRELVFMEGVSSREHVSELSGRGIGLAAVKLACEAEGGSIEVRSVHGEGTTFCFTFQRPVLSQVALAETLERRWSMRPQLTAANSNSQAPVRTTG